MWELLHIAASIEDLPDDVALSGEVDGMLLKVLGLVNMKMTSNEGRICLMYHIVKKANRNDFLKALLSRLKKSYLCYLVAILQSSPDMKEDDKPYGKESRFYDDNGKLRDVDNGFYRQVLQALLGLLRYDGMNQGYVQDYLDVAKVLGFEKELNSPDMDRLFYN